MRKTLLKSILLVGLLAVCFGSFAGVYPWPVAESVAVNFFKLNARNTGRGAVTATLKYTKTEADGTVDFYVFDMSPGKGFVIISADDQITPIIGYSFESNFNMPTQSQAMLSWMNHAGNHIHAAIQHHSVANASINGQWAAYKQGQNPGSPKSTGVAPLLTTSWNQEPYYNKLCPYNTPDQQRALTGCVATAMAQIMKYWNYPTRGTGSYAYNNAPPSYTYNYGSQSANFGNTTYNWAGMPDTLNADNANIAKLMYHCGVAVAMNYGDDNQGGSGAAVLISEAPSWKPSAQMAYATYFGYNPNTLTGVKERDYTAAAWLNLMESELNAGRPIQYEGTDVNEGGHTWVCDGYDGNDFLHMNWGWGGLDNGYYNIASLSADGYNFSSDEAALIGIEPMSDLTVTASATPGSVCSRGSVTLSATSLPNVSYLWAPSTGLSCATCATTMAKPDTTTTYTITIDSAGRSATSQVTVSIVASQVNVNMINISNASAYGASNGSAGVNISGGTPGYTYVWNNGQTGATDTSLAAGTYTVTISDATGCTATAVANVTQPGASATPDSSTQGSAQGGGQPSGVVHHDGRALNNVTNTTALKNNGTAIYVQHGGLIAVQGDFVNTLGGGSAGKVYNDGIMEVSGNFQNDSGAVFTTGTNTASTDRAVKFMGTGTQAITGVMTGASSFYNLVIDQAHASDTVEMQAPLAVQGSIVFGTTNTTTTYSPSAAYTNNNQKGVFKTFNNTLGEFLLDIQNGSPDAIAGYPVLEMGGAPSTGFILTSGLRGSDNGGVQRKISSATSYLFPIGTYDKGFNAMRLNFQQVPGNGSVKMKFCSGSSNPAGTIGTISQYCEGCQQGEVPAGGGYNRYFASNECNNGTGQWVAFEKTVENHGYWSLASTNTGYTYDVEIFANSYGEVDAASTTRVIKHEAAYGVDPSTATTDWRPEIESLVTSANDLLTYTKNAGCYQGTGIPGGTFKDFSHFSLTGNTGGTALPVQLLYLKAEATGKHHILVSWATALEVNNKGFYVMRSADGTNFADVGWVDGHNNSTVNQTYTFDDRPSQNIVYYYKLRQVDNNGHFVYSNIAEAQLEGGSNSGFALYPNPTANDIFLDVKDPGEEVKVELYDIKGQLLFDNIFMATQSGSEQTFTINVSSLVTQGTYILNASTNGNKWSSKVVFQ